jgi:hypothetical protein
MKELTGVAGRNWRLEIGISSIRKSEETGESLELA